MEKAVAESEEADVRYGDDILVIREFCEEAIRSWNEIVSALRNRGEVVDRFYLDRARSHYSKEN